MGTGSIQSRAVNSARQVGKAAVWSAALDAEHTGCWVVTAEKRGKVITRKATTELSMAIGVSKALAFLRRHAGCATNPVAEGILQDVRGYWDEDN